MKCAKLVLSIVALLCLHVVQVASAAAPGPAAPLDAESESEDYVAEMSSDALQDRILLKLLARITAIETDLEETKSKLEATESSLEATESRLAAAEIRSVQGSSAEAYQAATADLGGGVTYTRWGRTDCDDTGSVLYRGFAGGSPHNNAGNGADFLCMHKAPIMSISVATDPYLAYIVGIEYAMSGPTPFSTDNNYGQNLVNNDMPCTVCHIQTRSAHVMIPGRDDCPTGWTREYWGYIVSAYPNHNKSTYMCLDNAPESVPGGAAAASYPAYVYTVTALCNTYALPCLPFEQFKAVPCAVCTK